jgi:hypothetical protein
MSPATPCAATGGEPVPPERLVEQRIAEALRVPPPAPRQFALLFDPEEDEYAEFLEAVRPAGPVLWWGVQLANRVLLYRSDRDGRLDTARHASAEAALDRWSIICPLRLAWL